MNKREIIERLKNIAEHAVHTVGEEPFVMSLDDGIAVHEAIKLLEKPKTDCSGIPNNSDTISRQQVINALRDYLVEKRCPDDGTLTCRLIENEVINKLPSIQPKQNEMIKEIRRWINSGNRGNADYFIVDRIEEIINAYE